MTQIARVGADSWLGRIIRRYTEPAGLIEMPAVPDPPDAPEHLKHPDCPRCQAGTCTTNHLLASLAFLQPRSDRQEDRVRWSTDVGRSTLR